MSDQKRNTAGDKRAASLLINPRPAQKNSYGRSFVITPAMTDIEHCDHHRKTMFMKVK